MLTIGRIDYANCYPVYEEFMRAFGDDYRFVEGVPSRLNALLSEGLIDVSPSSSIEYARHADRYHLFPSLSISSIGPVNSVILFSSVPLPELDGGRVGLTTDSATSVVLLRILFRKYLRIGCTFTDLVDPDRLDRFDAFLVIGDQALLFPDSDRFPYSYDLGLLWYECTGLPFVFALWIVHDEAVRSRRQEVEICARRFREARDRAVPRYRELAETCRHGGSLQGIDLVAYWQAISYEFTSRHEEGLLRYYADAVELGLLGEIPPLRIIER